MKTERESQLETEVELSRSYRNITISPWLKYPFIIILLIIVLFSVVIYWQYIKCPNSAAKPEELGLSGIFLFCLTALFVILLPWKKLGVRIKKIGIFEFEQIVAEQVSEQSEVINYLEERIDKIEDIIRSIPTAETLQQVSEEPQISQLIKSFFENNPRIPMSALKIRQISSSQEKFKRLSRCNPGFMRYVLRKLVDEGFLATKISKKGNTLYQTSPI